ncbi:hypothetical protein Echvi_4047 [Echinicola vietnamensis DSM 17526]|uniref:Uncharacterized protein n=1 Tax=Echinicola vietnamensis (strain DSM 17526 / LMG 23754 / KMM 6221) TaxID=926556 RepID=L0G202_ECHVK|nr:hypothetical protein Echvi_4047 [Echinicola vietnamensis DSM 17526]
MVVSITKGRVEEGNTGLFYFHFPTLTRAVLANVRWDFRELLVRKCGRKRTNHALLHAEEPIHEE